MIGFFLANAIGVNQFPYTLCKCGVVPVPENQLPVILPEVEKYQPTGTGESPLQQLYG